MKNIIIAVTLLTWSLTASAQYQDKENYLSALPFIYLLLLDDADSKSSEAPIPTSTCAVITNDGIIIEHCSDLPIIPNAPASCARIENGIVILYYCDDI